MTGVASPSPSRRAWLRFKRNKLGYWSLLIFCVLVVASLFAEVLSNDRPLVVRYEGQTYLPLFNDYPETVFGGDFESNTDYLDPFIRERLTRTAIGRSTRPTPTARRRSTTSPRNPTPRLPPLRTGWVPTTVAATCWRS